MSKADRWLTDTRAVELIREARDISDGPAIKLLIDVCAQGLVRARQRLPRDDWGPVIPPSVWRDAHLDLGTGQLFPAGVDLDHLPVDERGRVSDGGYGLGGNGVIEISETDLREYLRKPAPAKRGRKPKVDAKVEREIRDLLEQLGAPAPGERKWESQADIERAILDRVDIGESAARDHARRIYKKWEAEKAEKGR